MSLLQNRGGFNSNGNFRFFAVLSWAREIGWNLFKLKRQNLALAYIYNNIATVNCLDMFNRNS